MSDQPSRLTADEARTIWQLAVKASDPNERKLARADAMHDLRKVLSAHAKDWQAKK